MNILLLEAKLKVFTKMFLISTNSVKVKLSLERLMADSFFSFSGLLPHFHFYRGGCRFLDLLTSS